MRYVKIVINIIFDNFLTSENIAHLAAFLVSKYIGNYTDNKRSMGPWGRYRVIKGEQVISVDFEIIIGFIVLKLIIADGQPKDTKCLRHYRRCLCKIILG